MEAFPLDNYLDDYASHKSLGRLYQDNSEVNSPVASPHEREDRQLFFEPDSLEGVASAYRYKLSILNPELEGCAFNFSDDLDVFNFNDVNKKRALKKEEWPTDSSLDNPKRWDVNVQLMAGNVEIKTCGGCSMWKDLTRKPFLMLTPHGNRCVQYVKKPFILLIFRCCPKFHSYAKQFKLVTTITSPTTGVKYSSEVNIYRKKMNNLTKKRKPSSKQENQDEETEEQEDSPPIPKLNNQDLDATLILHETLFPEHAALIKPKPVPETSVTTPLLSQYFAQLLQQPEPKKQKPLPRRIPQCELPFQQFQPEIEQVKQQYQQGQPQPQSSYSPQMLYDLLYKQNKPVRLPEPKPVVTKMPKPQAPLASFSLFEGLPEPNDDKWLDSLLEVPYFEPSKEGFEKLPSEDPISFNLPMLHLGF